MSVSSDDFNRLMKDMQRILDRVDILCEYGLFDDNIRGRQYVSRFDLLDLEENL
jgi:hypothetical protein